MSTIGPKAIYRLFTIGSLWITLLGVFAGGPEMNYRNGCALRFDLHTHPLEGSCITKPSQITRDSIGRIVKMMKK